uniref:Sigma 54 modulation/S30EA ribosomal protein C-terminal domain-containing protein n=1 Tax=Eucampia antarctica TaxID=49252 RepID=A0A7S2RPC0_9STRA|mmetsp:Transcript_24917/g.23922  ORF Transcript_24917/g.23922 Transcript_24917/m.23922 type:complete len:241 (+) Transcript_24917:90-812(+)|eukprot:CAMPEP_0197833820 /NCGR_PEP_ID=MMETSP1437-20131217/20196_1 /TAXON_ID=49252 ORGANISM="Eucampia antarctica, Strain CCMP1452" /NCGR_SAMPLE_ID=MMETSP1437 /ASSEMBLY_ACC=CAM_ASM_001096 /LENGTH=240 /DNA_ID=CAMNT_0043438095 /DNA_START=79 /DNA_END=801 /DNA_ORIENTATION=+
MRITQLIIPALFLSADAFTMPTGHRQPSTILAMSSTGADSVPIIVSGNNIEMTPALNEYINSKLERIIGKLSSSGAVKDCDVHLTVNKNPKVKAAHKAEVVTTLKGTVIRCSEETPDMYASIDAVTDRLARKLRKYKERRLSGYHGGPNMGENLASVLDSVADSIEETAASDGEEFVDPEAPVVTKIKSYDLSNAMTLQEAIFSLDYVDHDFYVFRDSESNEINVVYKRNAGGHGLIQPQ